VVLELLHKCLFIGSSSSDVTGKKIAKNDFYTFCRLAHGVSLLGRQHFDSQSSRTKKRENGQDGVKFLLETKE